MRIINFSPFWLFILGMFMAGCNNKTKEVIPENSGLAGQLEATEYNSSMPATTTSVFNGLSAASDGKIYYALATHIMDTAAQIYVMDPQSGAIEHLADLSEICGEKDKKVVAQGKVHVNFYESEGKLYFATHMGYYEVKDGLEEVGVPKNGFAPYPGGHFLSFDLSTREFKDIVIAPDKEGIITMNMDKDRGVLYGITWPTGLLLRYTLSDNKLENLGPTTMGKGEAGKVGQDYRVICRSIVVNPDNGTIYFTNSEGQIRYLNFGETELKTVENVGLNRDYFGKYDVRATRSMGYNWRQAFWNKSDKKIYALHGSSGYLFRFDPETADVEVLERLASQQSKKIGMYDAFDFGYLSFALGPDGHTVFYLTSAPSVKGMKDLNRGRTESKGVGLRSEDIELHLITYDINKKEYKDHGPVYLKDGQSPILVNSIAIGSDGTVYALGRIRDGNHGRSDLISIPNPLK